MIIRYIICTASGYYWHAYSQESKTFYQKDIYTTFDSKEEALEYMPEALLMAGSLRPLIIQEVYFRSK